MNNKYLRSVLVLIGLCSFFVVCGQTIVITPGRYQVDKTLKLIVCNQVSASVPVSATAIQLDHLYTFSDPVTSVSPSQFYAVTYNDTTYQLSFTNFPLVVMDTRGTPIGKNSSTTTSFSLIGANGVVTTSYAGITIRGALSSTFPKKSYKIGFWTDTVSRASKDVTLLDMRTDSDWLLLAMYNESLRINNVTSHALWRTMHQLYYIKQEPTALSAIRTRYVDVFVNGSYAGIYALGEQMDRKQLQLKRTRDNGGVRGELYKSSDWTTATLFSGMPAKDGTDTTWAGFELKYPNQPGFWTNLYGLVDSTVNGSDAQFNSQMTSKWQIDNLVDYFLFLNLVRATDNRGKNLYIARYKESEPYIIIAWDLDGTWGFLYDGSRDNVTNDILSNGFFDRLLTLNTGQFRQKLKTRWFSLRANLFATANLKNGLATNAALLTNSGSYRRENLKWPTADTNAELSYITNWIDNRTAFLDNYFNQFPDVCTNPAAPTVGISTSAITAGQSTTLVATGCPYIVVWNTGETGHKLTISPRDTSYYWAVCNQTAAACQSAASTTVTLTVQPNTDPNAPQADLSLRLISDRPTVPVNTPVRLTLTVKNNGPYTASLIRLQNRLPTGLIFAGNADPTVNELTGIINIALDSLARDQTRDFSYDVRPIVAGAFRNSAQILMSSTYDFTSYPGSGTGDGQDDMAVVDIRTFAAGSNIVSASPNPNQRPLSAVLSNQPVPDLSSADLSLSLQIDKRALRSGALGTITMLIYNAGGMDATGVSVQCVLPEGIQFVNSTTSSLSGSIVSASGLSVASGSLASVVFQVQAVNVGTWICQGQIMASSQPDPDSTPGNGTTNGEDDAAWLDLRVEL